MYDSTERLSIILTNLKHGITLLEYRQESSYISWDIMLCNPVKDNHHIRGTYRLHLQGRRVSQKLVRGRQIEVFTAIAVKIL
jgi:hypothetical protein